MKMLKSWAAAFGVSLCMLAAAHAQSWPTKPVTMLVGFPPGSNPDLVARAVANQLSAKWAQPVVVQNRVGAGSIIAAEQSLRAPPDGYTLFLSSGAPFVVAPFLEKLKYDPLTDAAPVALVGVTSLVLVANRDEKYKTFKDFIAAAKAQPEGIAYGSFGVGSLHHLTMEQMEKATGTRIRHIPYAGTGPIKDVLGGNVAVTWSSLQVSPLIEQGQLVALAYSGAKRTPRLPNVPTVAELGYPGFETSTWFGIIGPVGMPAPVTQRLQQDVEAVVAMPEFQKYMGSIGNEALFLNSQDFARRIQKEYTENKTMFSELNIKKE